MRAGGESARRAEAEYPGDRPCSPAGAVRLAGQRQESRASGALGGAGVPAWGPGHLTWVGLLGLICQREKEPRKPSLPQAQFHARFVRVFGTRWLCR